MHNHQDQHFYPGDSEQNSAFFNPRSDFSLDQASAMLAEKIESLIDKSQSLCLLNPSQILASIEKALDCQATVKSVGCLLKLFKEVALKGLRIEIDKTQTRPCVFFPCLSLLS
jgi:hypothetical protein